MDKFWEWMEEKRYGKKNSSLDKTFYELYGYMEGMVCDIPRQMLIGYMMEYLDEETGDLSKWDGQFPIDIMTTEDRLNWLVSKIEEVSK